MPIVPPAETILADHNIKPTAVRLLVLRELMLSAVMLSLTDLEHRLLTVDKSTISRTLALFSRQQLVHTVSDGSGTIKYGVYGDTMISWPKDGHVHFYCTRCHRTICLTDIHPPHVPLPEGYVTHNYNYILYGLCPSCN